MHVLVVSLLLATAPLQAGGLLDDAFAGAENPLTDREQRQRCLTAGGAGLAGALVGAAVLGGAVWVAGAATYKDADGKLVGEPDPTTQRFFVPGFAAAGAFLGGALATVGAWFLVEPDEQAGVIR